MQGFTKGFMVKGDRGRGNVFASSGRGKEMVNYYEIHGEAYFLRTAGVDPAGFLRPFTKFLSPGAAVLDVGCGSGRDLRWLKSEGFRPVGMDRATALVRLARTHSGCPVICADFEVFDFSVPPHAQAYDAILCAGAFVHLPHERLESVMKRILDALAPGGIFYVSVKEGDGAAADAYGRPFYFWRDAALRPLFSCLNFRVLHFQSGPSALGTEDIWLTYVLKGAAG